MEAFTIGAPLPGREVELPPQLLTESVYGQKYRVKAKTQPIPPEKFAQAASLIQTELPKRVRGIKIHYIKVEPTQITIDVEGSPFPWSSLLATLPAILTIIGIIIILIAIYTLIAGVPGWVWALLIMGLVLLFLTPYITPIIKEAAKPFLKKR